MPTYYPLTLTVIIPYRHCKLKSTKLHAYSVILTQSTVLIVTFAPLPKFSAVSLSAVAKLKFCSCTRLRYGRPISYGHECGLESIFIAI